MSLLYHSTTRQLFLCPSGDYNESCTGIIAVYHTAIPYAHNKDQAVLVTIVIRPLHNRVRVHQRCEKTDAKSWPYDVKLVLHDNK